MTGNSAIEDRLPPRGFQRCEADLKWDLSNRALSAWVSQQRPRFSEATAAARSIRRRLEALFPLLSDIGIGTCPWCPEPCCIVNRVWYDFRDVLFFHLAGVALPPGPLNGGGKEPCRYLTPRGCALPRIQRPWGCNQYLCATQRRYLVKAGGRAGLRNLEARIEMIAASRMVMEEAVTGLVEA